MNTNEGWGAIVKAIVCEKPKKFRYIEAKTPKLEIGHAIVNIKRIGICGTDIHAYLGNQPYFEYPRILGHELAGVIDSIEANSLGLKKGDKVAVIPYLECGTCATCKKGLTNCCPNMVVMGVHQDGGMVEQISVPIQHLIQTNELTLDQSAILEPLSIGAHAVRRSDIQHGESVLVIGAGPIGLGVMQFAKQKGAKVIAMDMNEERLAFAKQWANVDKIIHATEDPLQQLQKVTNEELPTVVFDATGNSQSMMQAFNYPANGGKIIFVGLVKSDITFSDPLFHGKELTLMASRNATKEDFEWVLQVLQSGVIDAERFITHRANFNQAVDVFDTWIQPNSGVVKAMIDTSFE